MIRTEAVAEETDEGYTGRCWCNGARDNWFSLADLQTSCGGMGTVNCFCGGDLCVCHNHGEAECLGCEDCEDDGDESDDYGDDDGQG